MSADNVKAGAILIESLAGLAEVRAGLRTKQLEQDLWFRVAAFDGDENGGSYYGIALIPPHLGPKILDQIEIILGDELAKLGIDPPPCKPRRAK